MNGFLNNYLHVLFQTLHIKTDVSSVQDRRVHRWRHDPVGVCEYFSFVVKLVFKIKDILLHFAIIKLILELQAVKHGSSTRLGFSKMADLRDQTGHRRQEVFMLCGDQNINKNLGLRFNSCTP